MKKHLSPLVMCASALILFFSLSAFTPSNANPSNANSSKKTIKIKNTTNFIIDEIYLADPDDHKWGSDIMDANEVLHPGEIIEVTIDCGLWDVKLVAQDKSTCELGGISLCSAAQWNITANCH